MKLRLLPAALLAALALAGCADVKPGVAVDVDGATLSMRELDARSVDYCALTGAVGQGQGQSPTADARRDVATSFIVGQLAERVAEDEGVTVPPSRSVLPPDQVSQARQALGDATLRRVRPLLDEQARTGALVAAIGAKEAGFDYAGATDEELGGAQQQLVQAGSQVLQAALPDADITVDPRLGIDPSTLEPTGRTGSLSVRVSRAADDLPAGQSCS